MLYVSDGDIEKCAPSKPKIRVVCPSIWIHYVLSGAGYYNGRRVEGGEAFIVYKDDLCEYYPDPDDPWTYFWVRIAGEDEENLKSRCSLPFRSGVFRFSYSERLIELAERLVASGKCVSTPLIYRESVAKLILSLNAHPDSDRALGADRMWVERAKEYISANYHRRLRVEEIAASLHIDRKYMRNIFVRHTGACTMDYLLRFRMMRAKELLSLPDIPVSVVAISVGYDDPLAFSKAFKKHCGLSPLAYKKNCVK